MAQSPIFASFAIFARESKSLLRLYHFDDRLQKSINPALILEDFYSKIYKVAGFIINLISHWEEYYGRIR